MIKALFQNGHFSCRFDGKSWRLISIHWIVKAVSGPKRCNADEKSGKQFHGKTESNDLHQVVLGNGFRAASVKPMAKIVRGQGVVRQKHKGQDFQSHQSFSRNRNARRIGIQDGKKPPECQRCPALPNCLFGVGRWQPFVVEESGHFPVDEKSGSDLREFRLCRGVRCNGRERANRKYEKKGGNNHVRHAVHDRYPKVLIATQSVLLPASP